MNNPVQGFTVCVITIIMSFNKQHIQSSLIKIIWYCTPSVSFTTWNVPYHSSSQTLKLLSLNHVLYLDFWTFIAEKAVKHNHIMQQISARYFLKKENNLQPGISRYMLNSLIHLHIALSQKNTELNHATVKSQTNSHTYKLLHAMQVKPILVHKVLTAYYVQDYLYFRLCLWPKDCQQLHWN